MVAYFFTASQNILGRISFFDESLEIHVGLIQKEKTAEAKPHSTANAGSQKSFRAEFYVSVISTHSLTYKHLGMGMELISFPYSVHSGETTTTQGCYFCLDSALELSNLPIRICFFSIVHNKYSPPISTCFCIESGEHFILKYFLCKRLLDSSRTND